MTENASAVPEDQPSSFDEIYGAYRSDLVRVAYLSTGSHSVAEEIVQDAFLSFHQEQSKVANPGGFLRTVVVRRCSTWRTRQAIGSRALARLAEPPPVGEPRIDTIWETLTRIEPIRRVALVLRFYEDLDYREIARLMECSIVTARTRVHRGLADLREELER